MYFPSVKGVPSSSSSRRALFDHLALTGLIQLCHGRCTIKQKKQKKYIWYMYIYIVYYYTCRYHEGIWCSGIIIIRKRKGI